MRLLRSRVCHAALPFPVFPLCRFPVLPFRHAFCKTAQRQDGRREIQYYTKRFCKVQKNNELK